MKTKIRAGGIVALATTVALVAAACGGGTENGAETPAPGETNNGATADDAEPVTLTWWHNGNNDPLLSFWQSVADAFTAEHPNVTFDIQAIQNEDLRNTVLPNAIAAGETPDIFQSWGGGELRQLVDEGVVRPLDGLADEAINAIGTTASGWQVDGTTYGLPYTFGPSGFWVNRDVWEAAGLTDYPETMDELIADWNQIAANTDAAPVALGGGSTWPVGHWWYWTAVKTVPTDVIAANLDGNFDFSDPNWTVAGEALQKILDANPFNQGWQTTPAQEGAVSASGQVVLGTAAMQLMGAWDIGVMGGIYNEANGLDADTPPPAFLDWFPFPAIDAGDGDGGALLGGGDGFSVSADAPDEAVEFLNFLLNAENQSGFATAATNIPTNPDADTSGLPAPVQRASEVLNDAPFVALWFDAAFGPTVGDAMNGAIVAFVNGEGAPADIVNAMQNAAS